LDGEIPCNHLRETAWGLGKPRIKTKGFRELGGGKKTQKGNNGEPGRIGGTRTYKAGCFKGGSNKKKSTDQVARRGKDNPARACSGMNTSHECLTAFTGLSKADNLAERRLCRMKKWA